MVDDYTARYLSETALIAARIDNAEIERMIDILLETREAGGRLFFLGVGGSAGNAGHAVNDFARLPTWNATRHRQCERADRASQR